MANIQAFIFDLDGVITDTAEHHYLAWKQLAEENGITFDREFNEQLKGVNRMDSLDLILKRGGRENDFTPEEKEALATKKNDQYKQLITGITPEDILPGVLQLLKDIKAAGIKVGLASASKNAFAVIDSLGVREYFDYMVDAATVEKGKPHPEVFLKAAENLGVDPADCVGVEDAEAGVEAVKAAGMFAVGVGTPEAMAKADYIVTNTADLSLATIQEKYTAAK
ncbi:beta-phosphoglucomutase [Bacillus sp. HMF5848]|uniref:beta-phosphoglucomutase n=1 Tax=Bacillus sp. HMF5848 TaxID=2495421 RepID=UPI000F7B189A|nr:beta-phosphoglucomutase [Bacillus sp. HMF5848]RSK26441.1 beta-phosphoglucomutase [Bacillus sp. HMF5848]